MAKFIFNNQEDAENVAWTVYAEQINVEYSFEHEDAAAVKTAAALYKVEYIKEKKTSKFSDYSSELLQIELRFLERENQRLKEYHLYKDEVIEKYRKKNENLFQANLKYKFPETKPEKISSKIITLMQIIFVVAWCFTSVTSMGIAWLCLTESNIEHTEMY